MEYDNKLPIYQQIMDNILLSIARGELTPGCKIAPVREMAAIFKVNPNTMQRSLAKLEEMGFLFSVRTSGRYVTEDVELIERLKSSLPEQITKRYVNDMLEYGIAHDAIADYVRCYIEKDDSQSHQNHQSIQLEERTDNNG